MTRPAIRRPFLLAALAVGVLALGAAAPAVASAPEPAAGGEVVVGYAPGTHHAEQVATARQAGASPQEAITPTSRVVRTRPGESTRAAIVRLRRDPDVTYAVPNVIAHAATDFMPNDPGRAHERGGWRKTQWNFLAGAGIDAPAGWANLIAARRPGARGVRIAVLDTGIAYRNWGRFRRSPDLGRTRFASPWDFVSGSRYALDRNGHGTHVASTIAESTNNGFGLTGIAYGATVIPVRVLDRYGNGDAATIARGIRYAANRGAKIINMSLEFPSSVRASEIPDILSAVRYARRRGALIVAAAGNESARMVAYPARASGVVAVGATTEHRCLADYSNEGSGLDLVAPGGGPDATIPGDPNCRPDDAPGRDIVQLTLVGSISHFAYDAEDGTSMATPHVSGVAALVVASGVIGRHPSPAAITKRLKATARPMGDPRRYGAGLVDAGAATRR